MKHAEHDDLLSRGEELYRLLLEKTVDLSRGLDSLGEEEIGKFLEHREQIMTGIQIFDSELTRCFKENGESAEKGSMESVGSFLKVREEMTRKIVETDALIVAFLKGRMSETRNGLQSLARGREALMGYDNGNQRNQRVIEGCI